MADIINGLKAKTDTKKSNSQYSLSPHLLFKYSQHVYIPTYTFQLS